MAKRQPFVVGRRTARGLMVLVLRGKRVRFRGPWTLRAVVSEN